VLSQVSPLTPEEIDRSGTIALSKYNRLMIVTPRALLRGYPWRDTLAHEYVHLVVSRLSNNNAPIWLHEGLAKFLEAAWRSPPGTSPPLSPTQEHLLAEALRGRQLIRWEQMHPSMAKLPSQRAAALAFAEVQTAIEFVAHHSGAASLRRLIDALRSGRSDFQALFAATGLARSDFDRGWRKYLRGLNLRRLTGLIPEELRFGKEPTKEQRIAAVKEGQARKFLRLAEMLRARGLTRAAIVEYQKARGLLGPRDELVTNHLARAYLEISSPAQAIDTLLPVLEYYPDLPGPQVTIGTAYLRSGDMVAAQRHLRAAFRINPFDPEIHCNLALVLRGQSPAEAALHQSVCAKLAQ
jgi:tetratricopeptide (TPR) repeat protein